MCPLKKSIIFFLSQTPLIKTCMVTLKEIADNPALVLTIDHDVFNHQLEVDDVLLKLRSNSEETSERFFFTISLLAKCFLNVLSRQLGDYTDGELADPQPDLMAKTSSAPVHNIFCERVLGMVDAQVKRAPNASMAFVDAKVKCLANKTMEWLVGKPSSEQVRMISFAINFARRQVKVLKSRDKLMRQVVIFRQTELAQKRDKTDRNKLERNIRNCLETGLGLDDDVFSSLLPGTKENFNEMFQNPVDCLPLPIRHVWHVDGEDKVFEGEVVAVVTKNKKKCCRVVYSLDDIQIIPVTFLIADAIMGDFHFS